MAVLRIEARHGLGLHLDCVWVDSRFFKLEKSERGASLEREEEGGGNQNLCFPLQKTFFPISCPKVRHFLKF